VWYAPRFAFEAAGQKCLLQVAVNASMHLSWVRLTVGQTVVYEEGQEPERPRLAPILFYATIGLIFALVLGGLWLAARLSSG
jgi:hypothetical protein